MPPRVQPNAFPRRGPRPPHTGPDTPATFGPLQPAAIPGIPAFPAGFAPQPSDFDTWITNPMRWLARRIMFRAVQTATQPVSGATRTILTTDLILEDPYGGWSATATGSQAANSWQPPFDGIYEVTVAVNIQAGGSATLIAGAWLTQASIGFDPLDSKQAGGSLFSGAAGSIQYPMAGGQDYVQGIVWAQNASNTTNGDPARYSSIDVFFVSQ